MRKLVQVILCASLIALLISGCVGLTRYYPDECKNETPTIFARNHALWLKNAVASVPLSTKTKADFTKAWGKPDRINAISENKETWIYERHEWCGVIPCIIIPVPLLLPVCDAFERIEFEGDNATRLDVRRIVVNDHMYWLWPLFPGVKAGEISALKEKVCWNPLPDDSVAQDAAKPAPQTPP